MSWKLDIHGFAQLDIAEAAVWYDQKQQGLGKSSREKFTQPFNLRWLIPSSFRKFIARVTCDGC
jgi:hypothetical protein